MRLGQLARKLSLRPGEIVSFLAGNDIQIEEGSNTRLLDEHVVLVMDHFAPANTREVVAELELEHEETETLSGSVETSSTIRAEAPPVEGEVLPPAEPEVIRAPKVELSGLRVVGKIDLPEPKKKQVEPAPGPPSQEGDNVRKTTPRKNSYQKKDPRKHDKNPVALQREREALEVIKKREARAKAEKEKKTQSYFKKVNPSAPTRKVKLVDEPVMEGSAHELTEPPKTLLGRFFQWLTT